MDPNANLLEQERILVQVAAFSDQTFGGDDRRRGAAVYRAEYARLLDLRQALYDWIRDGGFEPDWTIAPAARAYYGR